MARVFINNVDSYIGKQMAEVGQNIPFIGGLKTSNFLNVFSFFLLVLMCNVLSNPSTIRCSRTR